MVEVWGFNVDLLKTWGRALGVGLVSVQCWFRAGHGGFNMVISSNNNDEDLGFRV